MATTSNLVLVIGIFAALASAKGQHNNSVERFVRLVQLHKLRQSAYPGAFPGHQQSVPMSNQQMMGGIGGVGEQQQQFVPGISSDMVPAPPVPQTQTTPLSSNNLLGSAGHRVLILGGNGGVGAIAGGVSTLINPLVNAATSTPGSSLQVARRCYYCYGTPDVCERSNIQYYCNENERFCKLDVNTIAYPYVKQQCHSSCVENVKSDGTGYTYCTRVDLGNCYRQQCNRISGGERVGASVLVATTLALAAVAL